ncbi:transketolase [Clostridia bacterium]|nr:transketolase [Clostridia bacterium]
MMDIEQKSVNAIRILAADMVQKANSGHPGLPLGAADIAYTLWAKHMNHNPKNPDWMNRDRFVLSGGHGSALLYALLHLFGYGLSVDDLKQFRQLDSLTPGHPEYGHTAGVEATTGPLGAGMAMAVGMAMAEAHLAEIFNQENYSVIDHYTYVLGGDGCMMEGISSEAFSLAGTLGLSKLIVCYDANKITIEGSTDIAFSEDVGKRMEAFGFQVLEVQDANQIEQVDQALQKAKAETNKPSFLILHTKIGYGSLQQGKASAHGEPLGVQSIQALKENFLWENQEAFFVPENIYEHYVQLQKKGEEKEKEWNSLFFAYQEKFPDLKNLWDCYFEKNADIAQQLQADEDFWLYENKDQATRNLSGAVLQKLKDKFPNLIGGAADLAPSTKTYLQNEGDFSKENYAGRNLHFGVRELAMTAIGNGLLLHGGLKAFVSTFFVFSDYVKPMARLAALMNLPLIFVFTHDSIGVGEDGPTHEPIEQLAMLRATPNLFAFRPADARETAAAWCYAISSTSAPTALVLTRQNLPQLEGSGQEALKGGYILQDSLKKTPDVILMGSGSEVSLLVEAKSRLRESQIDARVVSMPCLDLFAQQDKDYQEKVLPKVVRKRVAVEALSSFGWGEYVGLDGKCIAMQSFGASGPANLLFEKFGFTVENIVETVKSLD